MQFINWVHENTDVLYNFGLRARDLIDITNESIEFLLQTKLICISESGELERNIGMKKLSKTTYTDTDITDCFKKATCIGKWFAAAGKPETVYYVLGVRP